MKRLRTLPRRLEGLCDIFFQFCLGTPAQKFDPSKPWTTFTHIMKMENLKTIVSLICDRFDLDFDDVFDYVCMELPGVGEEGTGDKDNTESRKRVKALKVKDHNGLLFDPISKRLYKEIEMED